MRKEKRNKFWRKKYPYYSEVFKREPYDSNNECVCWKCKGVAKNYWSYEKEGKTVHVCNNCKQKIINAIGRIMKIKVNTYSKKEYGSQFGMGKRS